VVIGFFTRFWDVIGEDFYHMLRDALQKGRFSTAMMKGMIILLFKQA
jgi:hypothetical protein